MSAITYAELLQTVPTHEDALNYFIQLGLIVPLQACILCGSKLGKHTNKTADGYQLRCTKKACRKTVSVRHNSWFAKISLSLNIILYMIYMWCHDFSRKQVVHELRISGPTVTDFFNMFREVCSKEYTAVSKIGGDGIVVQIDESHLFTRKYNVGRVLKITAVLDLWRHR